MIKKWKTVDRTPLLSHSRMEIVEDTVELPNGKQTRYIREAPSRPNSVAVLAFNEKDQLLIQREYSYPPDEILYQLPGGGIETGESVVQAAQRELSEESGYGASVVEEIGFYYPNNRRSDSRQYVVVCKELTVNTLPEDDEEFIESQWVSLEELDAMIARGEIINSSLLAALRLYESRNRD